MAVSDNRQPTSLSPFPPGYRASGVLLHVTSLPSPYGIGDVGPAARAWIDYLHEAGQTWWQALPLGPTGYGNSPYQSLSSFAGNWLLISPDDLVADGLLHPSDTAGPSFSATAVDYETVTAFKLRLLQTVWANFHTGAGRDLKRGYEQFRHDQAHWLDDYALFRALKVRYGGASYTEWPAELVRRRPAALARARSELAGPIDQVGLAQFFLFLQGERLKEYAHARGVRLIGDLPFYVSADSSDVWAHPELFLLDQQSRPRFVGGVPPDYFSSQGQLWGNPVYDWGALRRTGYRWYIDRVCALRAHVDLIRLDHFRGFAAGPASAARIQGQRREPRGRPAATARAAGRPESPGPGCGSRLWALPPAAWSPLLSNVGRGRPSGDRPGRVRVSSVFHEFTQIAADQLAAWLEARFVTTAQALGVSLSAERVLRELAGLGKGELDQPIADPLPFAKTKLLRERGPPSPLSLAAGQRGSADKRLTRRDGPGSGVTASRDGLTGCPAPRHEPPAVGREGEAMEFLRAGVLAEESLAGAQVPKVQNVVLTQ
jgi:hypothetical protein